MVDQDSQDERDQNIAFKFKNYSTKKVKELLIIISKCKKWGNWINKKRQITQDF